jgi:hypothetical protein
VAFDQARNAAGRIDEYVTDEQPTTGQTAAEVDIDSLQAWLDEHGLERIQIREQVNEWIDSLSAGEISGYTQDAISFVQGAAFSVVLLLFSLILIVVISIMLLDMARLSEAIDSASRTAAHYDAADRGRPLGVPEGPDHPLDRHRTAPGKHVHPRRDRPRRRREEYALLFGLWTAFIE